MKEKSHNPFHERKHHHSGHKHRGGKHQHEERREATGEFLEVKDLHVQYTSGKQIVKAVNGVSFKLRRGETLGLVGETGAGKTTIAKAILRVLPDPPAKITVGEIWLDDENLLTKSERAMLRIRGDKIAMIFRDPMTAPNPLMSVGSQIQEVIELHNHISSEEAQERTFEMLELVGIPRQRYVEFPHQFSGGMKQRVVIAMALACDPDLLLADEPTTALDVTIQAQVLEMIAELKEKMNSSMILITHDLGVIAQTCDYVAVVYAGQILESARKEQLFRHPSHPYTQGLFNSLPKLDDEADRLTPIPGLPPDPTNLPQGCPFAPRCPDACDACRAGEIPSIDIGKGHFVRCLKYKEEV